MSSPEGSTVTFRRVPARLNQRSVERFARELQRHVAKGRTFDCLVTGDAELRRLNCEFRGKDYSTDVLSFPNGGEQATALRSPGLAGGSACPTDAGLGDIAISLGRARAQAREFGHTVEDEIRILMLHGVLHLLGYDHERDNGRMARAEKRWRARFGLPNGLIERVQL